MAVLRGSGRYGKGFEGAADPADGDGRGRGVGRDVEGDAGDCRDSLVVDGSVVEGVRISDGEEAGG